MRPKWPKLASLAQKYAHYSFSYLVHSLLPKDNLFKNIFEREGLYHDGHIEPKKSNCTCVAIQQRSICPGNTAVTEHTPAYVTKAFRLMK